jgi:uncharacterized protein YbaP (TraB family)
MWAIEAEGVTHRVFGTMHVSVDARAELGPEVWTALDRSPCLVVEADQHSVDMGQLYSMSRLPSGQKLSSMLSPAAAKELHDRLAADAGDTLETSAPWFATLLLLQRLTPPGEAMDMTFVSAARAAGKQIHYLEDWREAIGAFAAVTDETDLEDLLLNEDTARADTAAMLAAYRDGDAKQLEAVIDGVNAKTPEADKKMDVLLAQRNARWLPRLLKSLKSGPCFVAVGVGHLVGKKNLLEMLKAKGFQVRREPQRASL